MAYNYGNYYPYGMPYGYNYPPVQNNQQFNNQTQIPNTQQPTQFNQYAFVNGIEGAKSFQVPPNQTMLLMDSDNPVVYMKQSNSLGQSTIRYFKLIETNEDGLKGKENKPIENYALKSDIDVLSKRIDEISRRLEKSPRKENKE